MINKLRDITGKIEQKKEYIIKLDSILDTLEVTNTAICKYAVPTAIVDRFAEDGGTTYLDVPCNAKKIIKYLNKQIQTSEEDIYSLCCDYEEVARFE